MPPTSPSIIYHIAPAYRQLTIWHADQTTGRRKGVSTVTPVPKLTRYDRYTLIAERLKLEGVTSIPPFKISGNV